MEDLNKELRYAVLTKAARARIYQNGKLLYYDWYYPPLHGKTLDRRNHSREFATLMTGLRVLYFPKSKINIIEEYKGSAPSPDLFLYRCASITLDTHYWRWSNPELWSNPSTMFVYGGHLFVRAYYMSALTWAIAKIGLSIEGEI